MKRPILAACSPLLVCGLWACGGASHSSSDAGTGSGADAGVTTAPMPRISGGVPAFASSGAQPGNANDDNPASAWESTSIPAWLAYDLSAVPQAQRQQALVAWYAPHTLDYINASLGTSQECPIDYTIEINTAAGGGSPPTSGWNPIATVTGNDRSSRQHLVSLASANWIRMNVTRASNPSLVAVDLDVHSAPLGATDDWLFMGDSITFISLPRAFSDLPALVHGAKPGFYPAVIDAAIGGTTTMTALAAFDTTTANFPGQYVVLAYGTNDNLNEFKMEDLVLKVIAQGKTPVVPHMPWSDTSGVQAKAPTFNASIDALYLKYPQIVKGPDLWAFFTNRTDLIPSGDVHPNSAGQEQLRMQWANVLIALDR